MSGTSFKGFNGVGESVIDDHLRANLISFFDWGFLENKNYENVRIPSSGQYGGSKHKLELTKDPRYSNGCVWQANRSNWVWQSGLPHTSIQVSGVNVNNTFYPLNTSGAYSHYVDYKNGRIIFNSPISTSATVTAEYSPKNINVIDANEVSFFKQVQDGSFRLDNPNFSNPSSGTWAITPDNRVQLPLVGVEVTSAMSLQPYQIGMGQIVNTKVVFHVAAEDPKIASRIVAQLAYQNDSTLTTFNVNSISQNNLSPLNYKGSIASGALTHPQMVNAYPNRKIYLTNFQSPEGQWINNLYYVPVEFTTQVFISNI